MVLLSYGCRSESDLVGLGASFAKLLKDVDLVLLEGELGAGKTCFARGIIQNFIGNDEIVTSPTFTLLNVFEKERTKIFHYDLYRLSDGGSLYDIEWEDARVQGICLVEWPHYIPTREMPSIYWRIKILYENNGRLVEISREGSETEKHLSEDLREFIMSYGRAGEVG